MPKRNESVATEERIFYQPSQLGIIDPAAVLQTIVYWLITPKKFSLQVTPSSVIQARMTSYKVGGYVCFRNVVLALLRMVILSLEIKIYICKV